MVFALDPYPVLRRPDWFSVRVRRISILRRMQHVVGGAPHRSHALIFVGFIRHVFVSVIGPSLQVLVKPLLDYVGGSNVSFGVVT